MSLNKIGTTSKTGLDLVVAERVDAGYCFDELYFCDFFSKSVNNDFFEIFWQFGRRKGILHECQVFLNGCLTTFSGLILILRD